MSVPDPGAELVEIVDEDGVVLEVVTRREMRARPQARHRCTYVVVVRTDGRVVVHQRAAWKDVSPSAWDLAFGGVCGVGESWVVSATRELEEEAGLVGLDLLDLGPVRWGDDRVALLGRVFVTVHDGPLAPADGEVVALDEVPVDQLDAWMASRPLVDDTPVVVPPLLRDWWRSR